MLRLVLLLNFIYALASVTHLVLQNNDIYTKERSEYDLTEFSSLQKVLEQDDLVKNADVLLNKLESVKRNIVDDAPLLNSGEDEITESDCLESGLLSDFDFSILPALEKEYEGYSQFEQYMCVTGAVGNVPLCSTTPSTFYMGDYRHITGVSSITARSGSPAYALLAFIPTDDIASYGHCLHQYLQKESTNWHAYFGASFYWRLLGNDGAALECIFKSLYYAQNNVEYRDGPLVSLSNLLSNAGHDSDAALVMEHSAESPYLQQLKTWSAGNLYTLAEQYKLSLDLYNRTVKLGPFPLADGRLQTLECYRTVIHRMENQNNVLRATLQKLQQRHQLETQYVGIQEQMFSNLRNSSLPAHIIEQVQSTEEAVRNTYKLVLEQQEIQNTLSASNVRAVFAEEMTEEEMTEEEMTEEDALSTERQEGAKKDVDWIKSTRFKLEKLVEQIKAQLSESVDVPIIYNCEDAVSCGTDAETLALIADAEEKRIMTELMTSVKKEANSRRVPVACDQNAAPGDVQDTARDAQDTPRDVQDTARDAHATSDDEHVASQNFMLFTDMFPFSEQINGEENREGCEVVKGESDSWYHLKCKVSDENIRKVKKDVKIVIREQSPKSASIELITEGSPESILPHIHITLDRDLRKKLVPTERSKTEYDGETLNKLISAHIQTDDIFRTMQDIRQDKINHNTENIENSVDINFGEDSWILRFYRVDTSPTRVVRIEQCDKYIPIFSHGDAYLPLMSPLLPYQDSLLKSVKQTDQGHPMSPDCTAHMVLDNCFLCYDELAAVNQEEYDRHHILEDFPLQELQLIFSDVELLGAAIDAALRKDPNNWLLYHLAATYHRTYTHDLGPAMQCTRRALAVVDIENRAVPLLTLANLLHQGRAVTDAFVVILELLAIDPDVYLNHIESSVLQVDIGKPDGQFRAAMDALNLTHSPISEHLLNSLLCYYDILKEPYQPPYAKFVRSKRISRDKRHPPFAKPLKAPIDGEIWRLEHHEGPTVDLTWVVG